MSKKKCGFLLFAFLAVILTAGDARAADILRINSFVPPNATVGQASYSASFMALGGTPFYSWSCGGTLPPGLNFYGNSSNASISGTPTQRGEYHFWVTVRDSRGSSVSTPVLQIKVYDAGEEIPDDGGELRIDGYFMETDVGASEVRGFLEVNGGTAPYKWSVAAGDLPKGLSLSCSDKNSAGASNQTTGKYAHLVGIPTKGGTYNFTLKVTDAEGKSVTKDVLPVKINGNDIDEIEIPRLSLVVDMIIYVVTSRCSPYLSLISSVNTSLISY